MLSFMFFIWDVTRPCPNLNGDLIKPSLKLGQVNVIIHPCPNPDAGLDNLCY